MCRGSLGYHVAADALVRCQEGNVSVAHDGSSSEKQHNNNTHKKTAWIYIVFLKWEKKFLKWKAFKLEWSSLCFAFFHIPDSYVFIGGGGFLWVEFLSALIHIRTDTHCPLLKVNPAAVFLESFISCSRNSEKWLGKEMVLGFYENRIFYRVF